MARQQQPPASVASTSDEDPGLRDLLAARDKVYAEARAAQDAVDARTVMKVESDVDPGLSSLLAARDDAYRANAEHQAARDAAAADRGIYHVYQVPPPADPDAFAKAKAKAATRVPDDAAPAKATRQKGGK
jgi:hypothetical protein